MNGDKFVFLHLITAHHKAMTPGVLRYYRENFDLSEHKFCILRNNPVQECWYEFQAREMNVDVRMAPERSVQSLLRFFFFLGQFDVVVMHGRYLSPRVLVWMPILAPSLVRKTVLIGFGQDIYEWNEHSRNRITSFLKVTMLRVFHEHLRAFIGIFPSDIEQFKSQFGGQCPCFYAPYSLRSRKNWDSPPFSPHESMAERQQQGKPIRILVGHRCVSVLKHESVLRRLSRFAEENIQVVVPQGQCVGAYAESIHALGKRLFNEKFLFLDHFLNKVELENLAANTDIAIFDADMQIALATIGFLFRNGVKIFLPSGSPMERVFSGAGVPVGPLDKLDTMSFQEFAQDVDPLPGYQFYRDFSDPETNLQRWKAIYKALRNREEK